MQKNTPNTLQNGFIAFHGNRAEDLAEVVIHWLQRHPLQPLEEEVVLVQSNGMAEWIKMEMARLGGVCAAARVELPSRFLWRCYRQVLGKQQVPSDSPLDKLPMVWRLMQLLPTLLGETAFAPVAGFLTPNEPGRLLQLASQLADLFDQYQNYRADWLEAWAAGHDDLLLANGKTTALPPEQRWQALLWRAILGTLTEPQQASIRPRLHQRFLNRLAEPAPCQGTLARRVVVFGMSQIPWSTLQALAALGQHCQVILAIPNPCRFYWGDIMDGRELFQAQYRRQPSRPGRDNANIALEDMHAHAHPLLAAWGRQGRDFIRQLDAFDDHAHMQQKFALPRVDLFDSDDESPDTPLLKQVQNRIRDLTPLSEHAPTTIAATDASIVFHTAHSSVRELEILHDQLLRLLAQPDATLQPRDVIVMVPDIAQWAPSIRAVFGQYRSKDARFIPFDIADMSATSTHPLFGAVDWLLRLPQQRCRMSELIDLLEVSPIALRFGISAEDLAPLTHWMRGAGIRWGLNEAHRVDLGLGSCGDHNSAWFGLRRMLLGYASGAVPVESPMDNLAGIAPYPEIGGLEAGLAGSLAHWLDALTDWRSLASTPASPDAWVARARQMLGALVRADTEADQQALQVLEAGLQSWQLACEQAGFAQEIPLSVARSAWREALEIPALNQRFRAGGVTFCTLMPMRAIPFEVVCLLGMNDGDYPRGGLRNDFDLMALPGTGRPGDRSRRHDDRQLMLEALLSARRVLYVSWCGHSVRDNSAQQPSVLVAQLRDYLASGWGGDVVQQRTTQHPLQPFSRRYFTQSDGFFTFAKEWRDVHTGSTDSTRASLPFLPENAMVVADAAQQGERTAPLTLHQLTAFLRNPVQAFFRHQLQVVFNTDAPDDSDEECFALDGLQQYALIQDLIEPLRAPAQALHATAQTLSAALTRLGTAGALPLAAMGKHQHNALQTVLRAMLLAWQDVVQHCPASAHRQLLQWEAGGLRLQDWMEPLYPHHPDPITLPAAVRAHPPEVLWLELLPSTLCQGKPDHAPTPRSDKLLFAWVRTLALAACGVAAQGVLVGRDGLINIYPMPQEVAQAGLSQLLHLWQQGMQRPLPLPFKTALAHLNDHKPASCYEGGFELRGEGEEPCLARVYPDYASLCADGQFDHWAQHIYAPYLDWVKHFVFASWHPLDTAEMQGTP